MIQQRYTLSLLCRFKMVGNDRRPRIGQVPKKENSRPSTGLAIRIGVLLTCGVLTLSWLTWTWRTLPESGLERSGESAPIAQEEPRAAMPAPGSARSTARSLHESALWAVADEATVAHPPPFAAEWSTEGRLLVRLSGIERIARSLSVGDRLALPVPQLGVTYRPLIEDIDDGPGARAFLGRTNGPEGRRRFVLTVGPESVFAYVDTPRGPYELLADHSYGWLAPSSSLTGGHAGQSASHGSRHWAADPETGTQAGAVGARD